MVLTVLATNDTAYNLACEEVFFDSGASRMLLWRNLPSAIIGRHQNTLAEIDKTYAETNNIMIVRRLTGGGAVYHDLGNINFSFINAYSGDINETSLYSEIILGYVKSLGIHAIASGRNDFTAEGKKFSGTAKCVRSGTILYHGTILFDTDLSVLERVLTVNEAKYTGKGIASVRSRVVNLKNFFPEMDSKVFWDKTVAYFSQSMDAMPLTENEKIKAEGLKHSRYAKWAWNFGESPKYNYSKTKRFEAGTLQIFAEVADGIIKNLRIYGDFFSNGGLELDPIEQSLCGARHDKAELAERLSALPISETIIGITRENLLSVII